MSEKKTVADKPNPNLAVWDDSCKPPKDALKPIKGGRMSGMTDINPQWRFHKLTELFGPVGIGWWTEEKRREFVPCGDEIAVFVDLLLYIKGYDKPIEGNGGNVFRVSESRGLRLNDECVKMATTDAVSVCCKQLGIGSAIYEGKWDGSKYADDAPNPQPQAKKEVSPVDKAFLKACKEAAKVLDKETCKEIVERCGFESTKDIKEDKDKKNVTEKLKAGIALAGLGK